MSNHTVTHQINRLTQLLGLKDDSAELQEIRQSLEIVFEFGMLKGINVVDDEWRSVISPSSPAHEFTVDDVVLRVLRSSARNILRHAYKCGVNGEDVGHLANNE